MAARPALKLTRRGLLAAAALGAVGCSARTPAPENRTVRYGDDHRDQIGRLRTPGGTARGVVVLVHGGFWSSSYGSDLMEPLAEDLNKHGYATWNIEYRRLGDGGGWRTTFTDVAAAFDAIRRLPDEADGLRRGLPVHAVGHSAGGQLVAWAASRTARTPGGTPDVLAEHSYSLAGVLDLRSAARDAIGGAAPAQLVGGFPDEVPDRYRVADPALLPPRTPVTVVVATADEVVPASQAAAYVARHRSPEVDRLDVPGGHFDLIDPSSEAWARVVRLLAPAPR